MHITIKEDKPVVNTVRDADVHKALALDTHIDAEASYGQGCPRCQSTAWSEVKRNCVRCGFGFS